MAGRILFELVIFLFPFALFGIYLLVTADAERDGRRKWPINVLFLSGLALALVGLIGMIAWDRSREDRQCRTSSELVDGVLVEGEPYDCKGDFSELGSARTDDPGGIAHGIEELRETPDAGDGQNGDPE